MARKEKDGGKLKAEAGGVVTAGTCVLESFRFRSARFSRVALVCKPGPFFDIFHAFFQSWPPGRNYVKE